MSDEEPPVDVDQVEGLEWPGPADEPDEEPSHAGPEGDGL